jgi:predicted nucleotidyltransferase component of viral defense system
MKKVKNIPASVRQKLKNLGKNTNINLNDMIQYYAMERFLNRLSLSEFFEKFILKGGLSLKVWGFPKSRPTKDIDMLGKINNDENSIKKKIKIILETEVEPDGIYFNSTNIKSEIITKNDDYNGIRILFNGNIDGARFNIQLDIGFSDIIYPKPIMKILPPVLNNSLFTATNLLCYSLESVIAEKFETMVSLGEINSRLKDFFDIWTLSGKHQFDSEILSEAIRLTFEKRGTLITKEIGAFSEIFIKEKELQWKHFKKRLSLEDTSEKFADIVMELKEFINPIVDSILSNQKEHMIWKPKGPWMSKN